MAAKNLEVIDQRNGVHIEIGAKMSLEVEDFGLNGKCTFIGQRSGQYIVVTPPPNYSALENKLRQADRIKARYSYEGDIFEFTSKLKEINYEPLTLLLLQYPVSVKKKELRSQKRINCFISTKMEVNNVTIDGIIKDISKFGCRCVLETSAKLEKALKIEDHIALGFGFPGIFDRQEILGKIKDIRMKESRIDLGVEFASIAWWVPPYD